MPFSHLKCFTVALLVGLLGLTEGAAAQAVMTFSAIVDEAGNVSTVQGTGVLVDHRGHILTTPSAIGYDAQKGPPRVSVALDGSNTTPAQIVACASGDIDVCLIKVSAAQVAQAKLAEGLSPTCAFVEATQAIEIVGFPAGEVRELARSMGTINTDIGDRLKYRASINIAQGMGGSPVLANGLLIGLAVGIDVANDLTVIQPLVYADDIIRKAGIDCTPDDGKLTAITEKILNLGLGSNSISDHLYDKVAFPLGNEHFKSFRNFEGTCPEGSYVTGVRLWSTTHRECNGCLASVDLICKPLLSSP